jgi:hypothetical protein
MDWLLLAAVDGNFPREFVGFFEAFVSEPEESLCHGRGFGDS